MKWRILISLTYALNFATACHQFRREEQRAKEQAEAGRALLTEEGPLFLAQSAVFRGWALAEQGQRIEGLTQIHQGLAACQATGMEIWRPYFFALMAETYGKVGQVEEGLNAVSEALTLVNKTGERVWEAELYRLRGELTLAQSRVQSLASRVQKEAEECFLKAIEIARKQQAKSLELRASMSLARLWQSQGKHHEARDLLADVYNWFTEGFDTKDLQEAKALIEELSH